MQFRNLVKSLLLLVLASCVQQPEQHYHYDAPDRVPASFLESYPMGSQRRQIVEIQAAFNENKDSFSRLYNSVRNPGWKRDYTVSIVVALNPDGSVQAADLVEEDPARYAVQHAVLAIVSKMNFGAAPGTGYFVFWYPITFQAYQ